MAKDKTLAEQLEEIVNTMCDDYCRYPREWDEDAEGVPFCESETCAACPLNKLI